MARNELLDLTGETFGIWKVREQASRRDNKTRWLCECLTCGAVVSHRGTALRRGKFEKCFGKHNRRISVPSPLKKPAGYAAGTEVFGRIKSQAKARGFAFSLTREDFEWIAPQPCHYCGAPPANKNERRHFNGAFVYTGIDRKDSTRGYEPENCVPSCATCNVMKQDMPYEAFLDHIARIYRRMLTCEPVAEHLPSPRIALGTGGNTAQANVDKSSPPAMDERIAMAMALRTDGKTVKEIAAAMGISTTTAWRAINAAA